MHAHNAIKKQHAAVADVRGSTSHARQMSIIVATGDGIILALHPTPVFSDADNTKEKDLTSSELAHLPLPPALVCVCVCVCVSV